MVPARKRNLTPTELDNIRALIHSPAQVAQSTTELVSKLQADKGGGIPFGFPVVDDELIPARPGDLVVVAGYTSNWKSGLMNWLALQELKRIMQRGDTNQIVIKVTWEQSAEEDTLTYLSSQAEIPAMTMVRGKLDDDQWKIIRHAAVERQVVPLWIVGHSIMESIRDRKARPRMTMSDVAVALDMIINQAMGSRREPRMIVMDYLQRIRSDPEDGDTMRERIIAIVNRVKDCAIAFGCPVYLGVQAGRSVAQRTEQIPELEDLQESSAIEQAADKILSLWYPIKNLPLGKNLDTFMVTPELLVMRLLKQKMGFAPITWFLNIDPKLTLVRGAVKRKVDH